MACSVNRFVNRTRRDSLRRGRRSRRSEMGSVRPPRSPRPPETARDARDQCRMAHNPEVEGSNPSPATSFRRSGPFPGRERAFCVPGTVVKRVVGAGLRAARQRDGGDEVTRDETAWTWWTLPPATAGRPAQRYPRCIAVCSRSAVNSLKAQNLALCWVRCHGQPAPLSSPRHVHSAARTQLHGSSNPSRDYPHLVRTFTGRDHLPDVMTNQPYGLIFARSCVLMARIGRSATR